MKSPETRMQELLPISQRTSKKERNKIWWRGYRWGLATIPLTIMAVAAYQAINNGGG